MGRVQRALSAGKAFALSHIDARRVPWDLGCPTFSITFDDVHASAIDNGGPILESSAVKGTWYVSAAFLGHDLSSDDVRALGEAGHDVQCHSRTHYRLSEGTAEGIWRDARQNRRILQTILPGAKIEHFSFPFGEVNVKAKRLLLRDYVTLRSIYPGINHGMFDLGLLRANAVYARNFDLSRLRALVRRTVEHSGWLIFYTHGVNDSPDPWSCRPGQLSTVMEICLEEGLSPATVAQCARLLWRNRPATTVRPLD